jgi:hypothetical protein
VRMLDRVDTYGPSDSWLSMIGAAKRAIDLSGITLRYWTRIPSFRTLIAERAKAGCSVRVLMMHPDNPAYLQYMNPRLKLDLRNSNAELEAAAGFFAELAAEYPSIQVRRMRVGLHHQQIVRVDAKMLASLVLYSEVTNRSPLFDCSEDTPFYRAMLEEFDSLWHANPNPPLPAAPVGT